MPGVTEYEQVTCKCGQIETVEKGTLTEQGKEKFQCYECRRKKAMPMESRVSESKTDGKKLLTEDL